MSLPGTPGTKTGTGTRTTPGTKTGTGTSTTSCTKTGTGTGTSTCLERRVCKSRSQPPEWLCSGSPSRSPRMKPIPTELVFLSARRTPFGTYGGSLKDVSATDLGVHAAKAAIAQAGVRPEEIDNVVFGNVVQTSSDAIYLARHVGLKAGLPQQVPALTVNRLCGSGFQAVVDAALERLAGHSECALVGGAESMSQAPHAPRGIRFGGPLGNPPT